MSATAKVDTLRDEDQGLGVNAAVSATLAQWQQHQLCISCCETAPAFRGSMPAVIGSQGEAAIQLQMPTLWDTVAVLLAPR